MTDDELLALPMAEVASAVRRGDLGPGEVAAAAIRALDGEGRRLNAVITVADRLPERVPPGPLAGVPVLVKDVIDTAGMRTTCGSRIFTDRMPRSSAAAVVRLEAAGAIVVGKANQHEFAWGLTSTNPTWGDVVNPRDPSRTPGGSSGGNAAAVAAGLVRGGIGTDTAGSLRIPAACCDVVGFKPSAGAVPTSGVFPLSSALDTVGPLAASVEECALLFAVLSGRAPTEPPLSTIRVAVADQAAAGAVGEAGLASVFAPAPQPPAPTGAVLPGGAWRIHRALFARAADRYDPNVREKLARAGRLSDRDYEAALAAMTTWRAGLASERGWDVVVQAIPGIPIPAADADELALRDRFGARTRWVNLAGWAAVAVGVLQISGPDDGQVLAVARELERVRPSARPGSHVARRR